MMELEIGDIIKSTHPGCDIRREILEVRSTGYTWRYPDIPNKTFISENSNDPFFEWEWEKVANDDV